MGSTMQLGPTVIDQPPKTPNAMIANMAKPDDWKSLVYDPQQTARGPSALNGGYGGVIWQDGKAYRQGSPTFSGYDKTKPWQQWEYDPGQTAAGRGAENGGFGQVQWGMGPSGYGAYRESNDPLHMQQYYTNQFGAMLPQMENQMGHQLSGYASQIADQQTRQARQGMSARGLLYGGGMAGKEAAIRNSASNMAAEGRSNINRSLTDEYNQMRAGTIKAGLDFQQQRQAMMDAIYEKAMAEMAGRTAVVSGALGAVGAVVGGIAGFYAGGVGAGAGAAAGYQAGSQAGKAL